MIWAWLKQVWQKLRHKQPKLSLWETPKIIEVRQNRETRRALERARRRHDKFVQPKVLQPVITKPAAPRKAKRRGKELVELVDDPNDMIIAGEYIEDDGAGDVLFEKREWYGEYNFRDSILDQLDRYWFYLKRMRHYSKDTYEFYRQVGAILLPYSAVGCNLRREENRPLTVEEAKQYRAETYVTPWFNEVRPSFGCMAFGTDPLTEKNEDKKSFYPKFVYWTKYEQPPPTVQAAPQDGDIYNFVTWWDSPQVVPSCKWGRPTEVPIFVSRDGKVIRVLKLLDTRMVRVGKRGNNFNYELVPQRAWYFPREYERWSAQHYLEPQEHLTHLFCVMLRLFEMSQFAMARVQIAKDNMVASFGIDPRRLSYFFQDRDITVNAKGSRKRVFHFVGPFVRSDGVSVKAHFRGERKFTWANYDVLITIPGKDHFLLPEMNVGVRDEYWKPKGAKDWLNEAELGKRLARVIKGEAYRLVADDEARVIKEKRS